MPAPTQPDGTAATPRDALAWLAEVPVPHLVDTITTSIPRWVIEAAREAVSE